MLIRLALLTLFMELNLSVGNWFYSAIKALAE